MNGVYINQTISSEMEAGKAPQVIVLPNDWQWPIERVKMTEAYPDFGNWSANSDDYKWIENKVSSKLIAR
jgi:LruC domain-containing protein